ncbi:BA14K family protein [Chelativorans sp. YIM 93263]|uniref:BA14K family protein n=1 Tax=Chelativorans sp. YIM 93263 TaxID=2906648 RepID=UPI0023790565|nr:BA14K family protein [Chelativorans sp. YIM 93263]
MKKYVATLCAAAMSLSVVGTYTAPAISAPMYQVPQTAPVNSNLVEEVNHRSRHRGHNHRGSRHRGYRHRGHRHRRSRRDNTGALLGGLAAGAILGGLLSNQPSRAAPVYRSDPHVQWCMQRYRSYDVRTDTFQPYNGPRRYCNSPYR